MNQWPLCVPHEAGQSAFAFLARPSNVYDHLPPMVDAVPLIPAALAFNKIMLMQQNSNVSTARLQIWSSLEDTITSYPECTYASSPIHIRETHVRS